METKVFFSEITKSHEYQNNELEDLLTVIPAKPVNVNVSNTNDCDFQPRNDKYYLPKKKNKTKVRTVRDIRTQFEKDILVDLPNDLERQENILLRKIRNGSSRDSQTNTIAKNTLKKGEPIKRPMWQILMSMNLEGQVHPLQFVSWNGKIIKINGSRGGKSKFLQSFDLKKNKRPIKNNGLKKNLCLKKKSLLQNSLSVNFKPCPLTKKKQLDNSYQKYNVGNIELVNLPKPVLEFQPGYGSALDSTVSNLVNNFRDVDGFISEKWAEFAVSVLGSTSDLGLSHSNNSPLTFDLSYKCDQRRILMRRDHERECETTKTKTSDVLSISASDESDIIPEVRMMINNMLNAVEISLIQDNMYSEDDELKEETQKITISASNVIDKKKKKYCELDRLDVTVIRLSDNIPSNNLSRCRNSYCTLGCICSSLQCALNLKGHCGRIECMFECNCDLSKYKVIDNFNSNCPELLPDLFNLESKINNKLAKEEKKFHQTVVVSGNQSMFLKTKRRTWKSSKKYADFYNDMCLRSDIKAKPILTVVVPKLNCENIEPWCMVHNLYRCFCNGKFVEAVASEKALNDSDRCVIILDNETPDSDILNKYHDKTTKSDLTRIRREKYNEKKSVSYENVLIDSENCEIILDDVFPDSETSLESRSDKLRRSYKTCSRRAVYIDREKIAIDAHIHSLIDTENSSCARTKPYEGRKYSIGNYLNAGNKIHNMEGNDNNLRKRLLDLVSKSVGNDKCENDVLPTEENKRVLRSSDDKYDKNINHERKKNVDTVSFIKEKVNLDQICPIQTKVKPIDVTDNSSSSGCVSWSSNLKMMETATDKRILDKPNLAAWLESSYQQYRKRLEMGLLKTVLEPPEKGKVALHPWDFILSRYSERKNLFLISKYTPFRIFMAVNNRHPMYNCCINIDDIRFADLHKYPITVKNLITNTSGLKDNFCILFGLSHCWELIGAVMKINDSKDRDTDEDITDTASEPGSFDTSSPIKLINDPPRSKVQESDIFANSKELYPETLENSESSKWFVMTIENDFTKIQFYKKGFFVKYESIVEAINLARGSRKTVRLSSQKCADKVGSPQFGIYAIPNDNEYCVFIGPYEIDENLGIETIKTDMKGVKPKQTRGVWITTNKVDNLKVIDNPLPFMPSHNNVNNDEMVLIEKDFKEVSKDFSSLPLPMPDVPKAVPVFKLIIPIKVRKCSGLAKIAPKPVLKSAIVRIPATEGSTIAGTSSFQSVPVVVNTDSLIEEEPLEKLPIVIYVESQNPNVMNKVRSSSISHIVDDVQSAIQPTTNTVTSTFLQSSTNANKQKTIKPVAEVAPQIKIVSVYSEATENQTTKKVPERSMFILKPEEINKRVLENKIFPKNDNPPVGFHLETNDTLDIEDFLDSSIICNDPEDETYVISDDEDDSPIKNIWIGCSNMKQLGWIRGRVNEEGEVSFSFPGFKDTNFYKEEIALEKINEVLYRKVYVHKDLKLKWKIISPNEVDRFSVVSVLKKSDLGPDICLTKNGLVHKSDNSAVKTYARKKRKLESLLLSSRNNIKFKNPVAFEQSSSLESEGNVIWKKTVTSKDAMETSISEASDEDCHFTDALQNIMPDAQEYFLD